VKELNSSEKGKRMQMEFGDGVGVGEMMLQGRSRT